MEEEHWSGEQWEGVPLAQVKEALARIWIQQYNADFQLQGAVGGNLPNVGEITDQENDLVKIAQNEIGI